MRKVLLISLLLLIMFPATVVFAATPMPPSWIYPEDYVIFDGSDAYSDETWPKILELRKLVESDHVQFSVKMSEFIHDKTYSDDPGKVYECELLYIKELIDGGGHNPLEEEVIKALNMLDKSDKKYAEKYLALLESETILHMPRTGFKSQALDLFYSRIVDMMRFPQFSRAKFIKNPSFLRAADEKFESLFSILILIDNTIVMPDATPIIVNGRTMLPIRNIAEAIGAVVEWDEITKTATITRAKKQIQITLDNDTALVNGEPKKLDVKPFLTDGRILLPLRFVVEELSQTARYDDVNKAVFLEEDMSFASVDSNMKAWFLGCGAVLAQTNLRDPYQIGMSQRTADNAAWARKILASSWGCESRDDVIETIKNMTTSGHNSSFLIDAKLANSMTDEEFNKLIAESTGIDKYMWPMLKRLSEKWDDRGIAAWDWFRMTHLAGWAYVAGYIELSEAYELAEPSIKFLRQNFVSWDEATDNYMDGYAYWARIDLSENNNKYDQRYANYKQLKNSQEQNRILFDETVWSRNVIK